MCLRVGTVLALLASLALAGCGDDAPLVDAAPVGLSLRAVDLDAETARCEAGEEVVSAFCYSRQGETIAASGVAFRMDSSGVVEASCLTGGKSIRLFCLKR